MTRIKRGVGAGVFCDVFWGGVLSLAEYLLRLMEKTLEYRFVPDERNLEFFSPVDRMRLEKI